VSAFASSQVYAANIDCSTDLITGILGGFFGSLYGSCVCGGDGYPGFIVAGTVYAYKDSAVLPAAPLPARDIGTWSGNKIVNMGTTAPTFASCIAATYVAIDVPAVTNNWYCAKFVGGTDTGYMFAKWDGSTLVAPSPPPPTAPTGLSATAASATQINLSWTDNSFNESGFKIFKDGALLTTTAAGATSYNATGLTCNTGYAFTVKATNANGDSTAAATTPASTTTSACVVPPPTAPTGLSATAASATQINLSWTDASSDETGFKIFKDGTLLNTTAANATSYNATGLTCNTAYTSTVKATNANGDSSAAATTPATTTTSACQVVSAPIFNLNQPAVIYSEEINVTK